MINFYGKFLSNLQARLSPLHQLLKKDVKFVWSLECREAFENVKTEIAEGPLLVHYDPHKQLTLVCDASPYGIGAILNVVIDNVERPCLMMSATLTSAQWNYSQFHREALAIVAAVRKFHKYIYGQKLYVYTDCEALESILSSGKNLDTVSRN